MLPQTRKKLWSNAANSLGCALVAFLLFALAPPLSQAGESVVWKDDAQLQTDPFGDESLFPGSSLSGNTLTIPSGTPLLPIAHGGAGDKGAVFGNTVNIQGGDVEYATGGRSNSGEVSGNTVHMSGGSAHDIRGGRSATGTVRDNSVNITGGLLVTGEIMGGYAEGGAGNVTGNSVTISDKATLGSDDGSYSWVDITGGATDGTGDASSNTVTFLGGKVNGEFSIVGGYSGGGNANSNKVTVTGLNAEYSYIIGGESWLKAANNNTVSVTDSNVGNVYGGYSWNGIATGNTVTLLGSTADVVIGAEGSADTPAVHSVSGNSVIITNSRINGNEFPWSEDEPSLAGGVAYGGGSVNNTVTITGSTVLTDVYGGATLDGYLGPEEEDLPFIGGDALNNTVTISGTDVTGNIFGGYSSNGNASGNTVRITDSRIDGDVFGGLSHAKSGGASSSNNLVSLENVTITGMVFGGAVQSGPNDQAINNTLILLGKNDLTAANLVGGSISGSSGGDQFTGNTLIVSTDNTAEVDTVESFENFAFTLPASASDGYVALRANDIAFGDGADQNSRVTAIMHQGGASPLRTGDTITLFQLTAGELDTDSLESLNANRRVPGGKGVTLLYDFVLNEDGTAEVRSVRANPRAKALSEGFLSGVALTNQGADLTAGQGMDAAMRANAAARRNNGWGVAPFAVLSGGSSRYDTGSHIDLDSFSLMAGLSLGRTLAPCDLTLGLFFEYGYGDYDTHNGFRRGNNVKGSGDTSYIGGGLLGRMDFAPTGPGRFHLEASARAGELDTDFSSSDLRDMRGRKADYDTSSTYYGLHVGLGYDWNITEQASLDLYGKYFWTHVEGDSVTLPTKDPVHFKDVDSHRLRTGARFTYAVTEWCAPYIGAAWEYEFDGEAKAASYGYSLDSPDLKGNTGIGELGLSFTPSAKMPLSLDLAVQGYTGVREGVSGSLQFRLEF